ncbi:thiamine-binding protein [Hazenella coriacea]|uniref:Uncharacterized protein YqgV (UPF0045/DUF77 family) n=1 Tax=Hazenella coriacea TaxID=1179467 RepID=A0A4R3LEM4_9BACL|nr:MTH1187 family thiamine-binding protein [Hazenella coriacea]TCS95906.1 uncharacterized protein YqgV (UPF0045/DUF77 family) [Hazenella coriacea]
MAHTLVSIQIIPRPPQGENVIPFVDRAIEIIQAAGVRYRVGPLETTMEGELPELLKIIQEMNEEMVRLGCQSIISQVKIYHNPTGASMSELTKKYD